MILTCPSCGTQYVVKDGAIPPGGRQVRCASCKHSWHQDPDATTEVAQPEAMDEAADAAPASESPEEESVAEATLIEPRSGPEAEERAYEEAALEEADRTVGEAGEDIAAGPGTDSQFEVEQTAPEGDFSEPPQAEAQEDEFTPFPAADEVEPKRRSPLVPVLIVILAVVIVAAAFWFLAPPEFKARALAKRLSPRNAAGRPQNPVHNGTMFKEVFTIMNGSRYALRHALACCSRDRRFDLRSSERTRSRRG
jgi:predicted Zn finger-like uncharacterized protein